MTVPVQETQTPSTEAVKAQENNLVNMRKQLEAEKAEKMQMKSRLEELERLTKQKSAPKEELEDDYDSSEPYVDPRTLNKKLAKFESRMESVIEKKAEEKARSMMEDEKRQSYLKQNNDFDQIMSPEVIQKFADKHPGLAESILRMPDGFDRQRLVYEAIKNTGAHKKEDISAIQNRIDSNKRGGSYQPSGIGSAPYGGMDFSEAGKKNGYAKLKELSGRLRLG